MGGFRSLSTCPQKDCGTLVSSSLLWGQQEVNNFLHPPCAPCHDVVPCHRPQWSQATMY